MTIIHVGYEKRVMRALTAAFLCHFCILHLVISKRKRSSAKPLLGMKYLFVGSWNTSKYHFVGGRIPTCQSFSHLVTGKLKCRGFGQLTRSHNPKMMCQSPWKIVPKISKPSKNSCQSLKSSQNVLENPSNPSFSLGNSLVFRSPKAWPLPQAPGPGGPCTRMMRGCTEATRDWSMMFILEDFLLAIDMAPKCYVVMARVTSYKYSTGRKAHL